MTSIGRWGSVAVAVVALGASPLVPIRPPIPIHFTSSHLELVVGSRQGAGCMYHVGPITGSAVTGPTSGAEVPVAYSPFTCVELVRVGVTQAQPVPMETLAQAQKQVPFTIRQPWLPTGYRIIGVQVNPRDATDVRITIQGPGNDQMSLSETQHAVYGPGTALTLPSGQTVQAQWGPKHNGVQPLAASWNGDGLDFILSGSLSSGGLSLAEFEKVIESLPLS